LNWSERRESNPHDQLGRQAGSASGPNAPVCSYDQDIQYFGSALLHFWVEIWVENRRRPESVKAGAAQSGSMHPAIRLLEYIFGLGVVAAPRM
jgi:hypothetical protein